MKCVGIIYTSPNRKLGQQIEGLLSHNPTEGPSEVTNLISFALLTALWILPSQPPSPLRGNLSSRSRPWEHCWAISLIACCCCVDPLKRVILGSSGQSCPYVQRRNNKTISPPPLPVRPG